MWAAEPTRATGLLRLARETLPGSVSPWLSFDTCHHYLSFLCSSPLGQDARFGFQAHELLHGQKNQSLDAMYLLQLWGSIDAEQTPRVDRVPGCKIELVNCE